MENLNNVLFLSSSKNNGALTTIGVGTLSRDLRGSVTLPFSDSHAFIYCDTHSVNWFLLSIPCAPWWLVGKEPLPCSHRIYKLAQDAGRKFETRFIFILCFNFCYKLYNEDLQLLRPRGVLSKLRPKAELRDMQAWGRRPSVTCFLAPEMRFWGV